MTKFDRSFPIGKLSDAVLDENGWLCDLLRHWHPSGDAIGRRQDQKDKEYYLRLAIRKDYLNFYRAGQSVAKVRFDQQWKLQAKIHNKYVYGKGGSGQSYVTLTSAGFPERGNGRIVPYDGPARLREWTSQANKYGGCEKKFVDLVVGRNPSIIDLEMGLPAYSEDDRRAPRMDLVAIERGADGWRVVFWEAKLVSDGRARCSGDGDPRVVQQLQDYIDWLGHEGHKELVAQAYQRTCRLLVEMHALAKRFRPDIEDLGPGIRDVAAPDAPLLLIDDMPRLLIDDRTKNVAMTKNGHLEKLRNRCLAVQIVQDLDQMTLKPLDQIKLEMRA